MILAEIADKMLPTSFFVVAAIAPASAAAVAFTFLRGIPRLLVISIIAGVTGFFAVTLQVDSDLVEATRTELGQIYLTISKYWIIASVALAAILILIFRIVFRSIDHSQNHQEAEQGVDRESRLTLNE